jgi:steroid delta-isomerase-like uncharacterized protein
MLFTPRQVTRRAFLRRSNRMLVCAVITPFASTGLSGLTTAAEAGAPERVVEAFYAAYAELNVEKLLALLTDDCFFEDPTFHLVARGKSEIRKMAENLPRDYSDVKIEIENRIACQGWVITQQKLSAVFKPQRSTDAAARNISVRGTTIFGVTRNYINRWFDYYDADTFRKQSGLKTAG